MADEFVRKEHFDEHVLRIDERFAHLEDTMNQRFLGLEKRMDLDAAHLEKNFAHVNRRFDDMNLRFDDANKRFDQRFDDANKHFDQRFDDMNLRFDAMNQRFDDMKEAVNDLRSDMREDMRQMRNWLFRLYGMVVFGFIGTVVLILFRELIFK